METKDRHVGEVLRSWRQKRRLSQFDLALDSEVSAKHISFLETGRSIPSRQMLIHLADHLDVPLRERNTLLAAAGYAPAYATTQLEEPEMAVLREAIDLVLTGHEPYPAIALDRYWNLVSANVAANRMLSAASPELLEPPVNVLRLSLHPNGLATRILNLSQWEEYIFRRLHRMIERTDDPALVRLRDELVSYAASDTNPDSAGVPHQQALDDLVIPLRMRSGGFVLSFFSTTTIFGSANHVTLSELAIESFFPADAETADALNWAKDDMTLDTGYR